MLIEDFRLSLSQFEELLQKITTSITGGIVLEKQAPAEIWKKLETDVTAFQNLAAQLSELMLILKPERAPTIKMQTQRLMQPLQSCGEILFRKSGDIIADSKLALEELRRAVVEATDFLKLAKEIEEAPSETILSILRLKEVYDSKEFLSAIAIPEATHLRLRELRKVIERLGLSVSNLEKVLGELRISLNQVVNEISKFKPAPTEEDIKQPSKLEDAREENPSSEPTLVTKKKENLESDPA